MFYLMLTFLWPGQPDVVGKHWIQVRSCDHLEAVAQVYERRGFELIGVVCMKDVHFSGTIEAMRQ